ncbi:MAG: ubiquinone biosynthesis protein UbiA [Flavipsychrobacter sp.]|jgi:4-hydroxybenzoate polyprenyltransferase|nr:ubiquinone biosynthesis protein UbiA [Flavipsychrobacter sp.]
MAWLKLIRWKNLAIILLTQLLVWWCVILPEQPAVLNFFNFSLLAISTVLIAAAGYIINDYFDIKIDLINRPEKVVLEKAIPRKQAIISHTVLNVIGLLLAAYVVVYARHYEWLLLQVTCTLLLWFYSTDLKRQYMTGNIAVSLLTALTIIVLLVYEPVLHHAMYKLPVWVLGIYAYFAFMLTWMREIVKDMEDFIGDEAEGCVTMPVKRGLKFAARYTLALSVLVVIPLLAAAIVLYQGNYIVLSLYVSILLVLPVVAWGVFLNKEFTTQHYAKASRWLKVIMLLGVFSLVVYYFQLNSFN